MVLKEHVGPVQRYRGQFRKTMIKSSFLRFAYIIEKKKSFLLKCLIYKILFYNQTYITTKKFVFQRNYSIVMW